MTDNTVADLDIEHEGIAHEQVELPEKEAAPDIAEHAEPADQEQDKEQEAKPKRKKKSAQERINEILYQKHAANEEKAAAQAARDLLKSENEELKQQLEEAKKAREAPPSDATAQIELLRKKRLEAIQNDDIAASYDINDEIVRLQSQPAVKPAQAPEPVAAPQAPPAQQEVHPEAQKWLGRNEWYYKPDNKTLAREADYIESQLRQQGYGYSEALYEELDRQLSMLPEFTPVSHSKPRVAPPSRGGEPPNKPVPNQLSDYDIMVMRKTPGLDSNNPKHRAAYLRYKAK